MKQPVINIGDPQPLKCRSCNSKQGYQYSDHLKLHYTTTHESCGKHYGGFYSEYSQVLNEGKTPYCMNCGSKLDFKIKRVKIEVLEGATIGIK
jgi:DNA-directed RNA polymerase subunit N (RpoN/RPB10)